MTVCLHNNQVRLVQQRQRRETEDDTGSMNVVARLSTAFAKASDRRKSPTNNNSNTTVLPCEVSECETTVINEVSKINNK